MRARIFATLLAAVVAAGEGRSSSVLVPAGGDLQHALNTALPGDTIQLEPGATYVGNFYLPRRAGNDSRPITVRTAPTSGADPVGSGERISPAQAGALAKLRSPDGTPALRTEPGARFWRVELLEFLANQDGAGDIITLGDGSDAQKSAGDVPSDLVLDRLYIHGDTRAGQKRAIALNSTRTTISNSYIANIASVGQDSQAIAGWNGPGDYTIENNYLEAAGENVIFGGADPSIPDLVPTRIAIRGNMITKPVEWHGGGSAWQVKNLLELKNARDVTIERNVLEHNWEAAQSGFAILFTVRNQDGHCPWCTIENVTFALNTVRDIAAGVQILGIDDSHTSKRATHLVITNNVFDGLDNRTWGGNGYLLQITGSPRDLIVDHNTVIQGASYGVATVDGPTEGFVLTNNIASHGDYGIIGANHAPGMDSIRAFLPGSTITANVLAGGNASLYPPGNFFPSVDQLRSQFVDFTGHDFHLRTGSSWIGAATDGKSLGADVSRVPRPPREEPRRPPR